MQEAGTLVLQGTVQNFLVAVYAARCSIHAPLNHCVTRGVSDLHERVPCVAVGQGSVIIYTHVQSSLNLNALVDGFGTLDGSFKKGTNPPTSFAVTHASPPCHRSPCALRTITHACTCPT